MKVLRVNSEELERLPIETLLNKLVYNHCKPGTGKTREIHQIIDYCIENELIIVKRTFFVIIFPLYIFIKLI